MNFTEIINARGIVANKFVSIEGLVAVIICLHYLKRVDNKFILNVLKNELSSFGLCKSVLKLIIDNKKNGDELQNLEKLNRIRNIFSHSVISGDSGQSNGDIMNASFVNHKDLDKKINAEEMLKEFNSLYDSTIEWLMKIFEEKGGNFK
ncbi:MAG: hypothetical protein PHE24_01665 [Patescibacteria group bacterium]|nr:hypothetical protein [Patescibacteria group bacterium]